METTTATIITAHSASAGEPVRLLVATNDIDVACEALDAEGVTYPAQDWACLAYEAGGSEAGAVATAVYWGADAERVDPLSVWYSADKVTCLWLEEHTGS